MGKLSNQLTYCDETKKKNLNSLAVRAKKHPNRATVSPAKDKRQSLTHWLAFYARVVIKSDDWPKVLQLKRKQSLVAVNTDSQHSPPIPGFAGTGRLFFHYWLPIRRDQAIINHDWAYNQACRLSHNTHTISHYFIMLYSIISRLSKFCSNFLLSICLFPTNFSFFLFPLIQCSKTERMNIWRFSLYI